MEDGGRTREAFSFRASGISRAAFQERTIDAPSLAPSNRNRKA